ncbi:MAG: hypothetical protein D6737_11665 [Chloroflexi bacterium]|nr:MAG: hypothetical protein D6737_11665 [Chloroflexota bacterium]
MANNKTTQFPPAMTPITNLTVAELQELIRGTVRETIREFLDEANHNAEVALRAEMTDILRFTMQGRVADEAIDDDEAFGWQLDD